MTEASFTFDDAYATLGVPRDATDEQIHAAYTGVMQENAAEDHPGDRVRENVAKQASWALGLLTNPQSRAEYDVALGQMEANAQASGLAEAEEFDEGDADAEPEMDHAEERWQQRLGYINDAHMESMQVMSHIPSGLICAGLSLAGVAGTVAGHGAGATLSMAVAGGIGFMLNAIGVRHARRGRAKALGNADLALTREWPEEPVGEPESLIVTAPPFAYPDPASGWDALDLMRAVRVPLADGGDPKADRPYFFPELREAIPPPSEKEYELLQAAKDGKKTYAEIASHMKSEEAKLRANPDGPDYARIMYGTLSQALQIVLNASPEEAFPVGNPLHPELEARLDMFASKLGLGSTPGCTFDVQLNRADGGVMVVRYDFPGDGSFGSATVPLEELQAATVKQQMADLNVPEAMPLSYVEPVGVWDAVDGMRQAFPEVDEAVRNAVPNEAEMRAAATTPEGAAPGFQVLGLCVQQMINTSTVETLDARLELMASIVARGATPGATMTLPLGQAMVRYTFAPDGIDTKIFTAEGVLTPGQEIADPAAPVAPEAPATPPAAATAGPPVREGL